MKLCTLHESGLSRIHSKLENGIVGFITAYRGEFTNAQNTQRNRSLLAKLMSAGYSVTSVKGSYIENYGSENENEVSEHTFLVAPRDEPQADTLENDVIKLGEMFDQDSVLIVKNGKGELVGTSHREEAYPPFGSRESVGGFKGGKSSEFMSRVNNRPFIFGEEHKMPTTVNGIRGLKILAEKDWSEIQL